MTAAAIEETQALQEGDVFLLIRDAAGIYIPQEFAETYATDSLSGVDPEDLEALLAGPDGPDYWEAWDSVLDSAVLTDDQGIRYDLFQDGDLWAVRQGVELPDYWLN